MADERIAREELERLFWDEALPHELARGFVVRGPDGARRAVCLGCGAVFLEGRVFPFGDALFAFDRAAREHVHEAHGSPFEILARLPSRYTGLSPRRRVVARLFHLGWDDERLARFVSQATSTVRSHRHRLRTHGRRARMAAAFDLALWAEPPDLLRYLRWLLEHGDPVQKLGAAKTFTAYGGPEAAAMVAPIVADLLRIVQDPGDPVLRAMAVGVLGDLAMEGHDTLFSYLVVADEAAPVRAAAAGALAAYGNPAARAALERGLTDADAMVREACARALEAMEGPLEAAAAELAADPEDWARRGPDPARGVPRTDAEEPDFVPPPRRARGSRDRGTRPGPGTRRTHLRRVPRVRRPGAAEEGTDR